MNPHLTATITLAAIPTTITLGYGIACWLTPFGTCRRCRGWGKTRPRIGRKPRPCRRCRGTGRRLRIGRRAYNNARRIHLGGTR